MSLNIKYTELVRTVNDLDDKLTGLDKKITDLIDDMNYKAIDISGFSTNLGTQELGTKINEVTLSWSLNKEAKSLTLDGKTLDTSLRSTKLTSLNLSSSKTWTLIATDERDYPDTAYATISFTNGVYYGTALEPTEYKDAFILSLTKNLQSSSMSSFTATAGDNQYIYYCHPVRYGECSFSVGGFKGGFRLVDSISFTNSKGYTESYYIYKSDEAGLGTISVTIE